MADWIVTAVFGGIYQRDGLSLRDRQRLNLAKALAALRVADQTLRQIADAGPVDVDEW